MENKADKKIEMMEKAGITDELVFAKLRARLDAKKKIRDRDGDVIDEDDDGAAIDAALDKVLKLKGYLAEDKGVSIINMDVKMSEMILKETRAAIVAEGKRVR